MEWIQLNLQKTRGLGGRFLCGLRGRVSLSNAIAVHPTGSVRFGWFGRSFFEVSKSFRFLVGLFCCCTQTERDEARIQLNLQKTRGLGGRFRCGSGGRVSVNDTSSGAETHTGAFGQITLLWEIRVVFVSLTPDGCRNPGHGFFDLSRQRDFWCRISAFWADSR